jgi:hypothetical protein
LAIDVQPIRNAINNSRTPIEPVKTENGKANREASLILAPVRYELQNRSSPIVLNARNHSAALSPNARTNVESRGSAAVSVYSTFACSCS